MRSRISGRLLPAALAAATVTAVAVPASAREAPPPDQQTYTEDQCAEALEILSYFELLPNQPDIGRALCSMKAAQQQQEAQQDAHTSELSSQYTDETGQAVEDNKLLGLPVEWPKSLTVHVPTVNDQWHSYTSTKN